jgi:hypothetical protein
VALTLLQGPQTPNRSLKDTVFRITGTGLIETLGVIFEIKNRDWFSLEGSQMRQTYCVIGRVVAGGIK